MSTPDIHSDLLAQRIVDRPEFDPGLRPLIEPCLREWAGVGYAEATVQDFLRASRAAAAMVVERSPVAAAAMVGRENFTAYELLATMAADRGHR